MAEIGLGGLLSLKIHSVKRGLCWWLLEQFDPNTCLLNVFNKSIKFCPEDVGYILGLHCGGDDLETNGSTSRIADVANKIFEGKVLLSTIDIEKKIKKMQEDSQQFRRYFVLYILGVFLCPSLKIKISKHFLPIVEDLASLKCKNLAKFVFEYMIQAVREYKMAPRNSIRGCIILLMVTYYSH